MIITRTSPLNGKTESVEIDVTEEQIKSWKDGALIQDAMPHLSQSDREFIMTGITDEQWHATYGDY